MVSVETLHDLARSHIVVKFKVMDAAVQVAKVLPHPPRRPGENWVRRFAHPVQRVGVRRTRTSATMVKYTTPSAAACFW